MKHFPPSDHASARGSLTDHRLLVAGVATHQVNLAVRLLTCSPARLLACSSVCPPACPRLRLTADRTGPHLTQVSIDGTPVAHQIVLEKRQDNFLMISTRGFGESYGPAASSLTVPLEVSEATQAGFPTQPSSRVRHRITPPSPRRAYVFGSQYHIQLIHGVYVLT